MHSRYWGLRYHYTYNTIQYHTIPYQGICRALKDYQHQLKDQNVVIYVRRGGPNYQEGLRAMRELGMEWYGKVTRSSLNQNRFWRSLRWIGLSAAFDCINHILMIEPSLGPVLHHFINRHIHWHYPTFMHASQTINHTIVFTYWIGIELDLPIHVFGPETHMTAICAMALGLKPITPSNVKYGMVWYGIIPYFILNMIQSYPTFHAQIIAVFLIRWWVIRTC